MSTPFPSASIYTTDLRRSDCRSAQIQAFLSTLEYIAPGIQRVGAKLNVNQVRFANSADQILSEELATQLNSKYHGLDVQTESIGAYATRQGIHSSLRVLELWLRPHPDVDV
jgi:hypothetical protein